MGKYIAVIGSSMLKFILGPLTGTSLGLTMLETFFLTVTGMMITVIIFSYLGTEVRNRIFARFIKKDKKLFTPRNRKIVAIWRKYGMNGIAFLTPLLFSPPIGTAIAISMGEKKHKIIFSMLLWAVVWGMIFSSIIHLFGLQFVEHLLYFWKE